MKIPPRKDKVHDREMLRMLSLLSQLGIMMALCVVIGVFIGRFLDSFLGTSPWLLLLFSFIGVAAAFKALFDFSLKK